MKHILSYPTNSDQTNRTIRAICKGLGLSLTFVRSRKDFNKITAYDGLILMGGADVEPWYYGEYHRYPHLGYTDPARDNVEWLLVRVAMSNSLPILGICRGMQMLVIAHGGSMWQDLKKDRVSRLDHTQDHRLIDIKRPLLSHLHTDIVNSRHHQGVKTIHGLKPLAYSPDRVIEAVYRPGVLGVQFHPEDLFLNDTKWIHLFSWFKSGLQ